jgi:DNA-binding MarR family transcriptional regulator
MTPTSALPKRLQKFDKNGDGWLSNIEISEIEGLPTKELEELLEELSLALTQELLKAAKSVPNRLKPTEHLSFEDYKILSAIRELLKDPERQGKVIQDNIAGNTGLAPARVSQRLNEMDAALVPDRGWISRTENPAARHQKLITVTEAGRQMFKLAQLDYRKQLAKIVGVIRLRELIQLNTNLYRLNLALDPKHTDSEGAD